MLSTRWGQEGQQAPCSHLPPEPNAGAAFSGPLAHCLAEHPPVRGFEHPSIPVEPCLVLGLRGQAHWCREGRASRCPAWPVPGCLGRRMDGRRESVPCVRWSQPVSSAWVAAAPARSPSELASWAIGELGTALLSCELVFNVKTPIAPRGSSALPLLGLPRALGQQRAPRDGLGTPCGPAGPFARDFHPTDPESLGRGVFIVPGAAAANSPAAGPVPLSQVLGDRPLCSGRCSFLEKPS